MEGSRLMVFSPNSHSAKIAYSSFHTYIISDFLVFFIPNTSYKSWSHFNVIGGLVLVFMRVCSANTAWILNGSTQWTSTVLVISGENMQNDYIKYKDKKKSHTLFSYVKQTIDFSAFLLLTFSISIAKLKLS